ncbi:hypothetical protein [Streptomyces sp. CT34]|uniref:hypothetical protein n=1 Tax=Streptomyces sp. CT34 TaxID=1553907 RepID=UPI0005BD1C8B|nr:hypothetical protein [Streptomyces sp. CT34]
MSKRKHLIKRTAIAVALVGAAGFAASTPAQAAPTSQDAQAPYSAPAGTGWHATNFQGSVKAVHAGSIDVDVKGSVKSVDTANAMVIGNLAPGVAVNVTNWGTGTVVVALNNWG